MNITIEEDTNKKIEQYKKYAPSPSYISGMIDGDGCIFIRQIKDGYQSGITLAQSRTNILQILRYHFGGSITTSANRNCNITDIILDDSYFDKNNVRNEYNLVIRSNEYNIILQYIKDYIIIKQKQIDALFEFSKIVNLPNKYIEKEELYNCCLKKKEIFCYNFSRLNIEYVQGLFDAEGCVYINKNNYNNYTISIAQKNHPTILHEIQKLLGFGKVNKYDLLITKKKDCLQFIQLMKIGVIVKYNQVIAFETFLQTTDLIIKEQMYRITNEEKHKIEHFTNLNQNEEGKEGYLEFIKLKELKRIVCNQILAKESYKQKSENMMGESNHNFGKKFSEEHKKKMSISIRESKNSVSDAIIIKVKQMFRDGLKNIEIQELMNIPRHTITRIKNGTIICRTEEKLERVSLTQEEVNLSKRKIQACEIIIVLEKFNKGWSPLKIFEYLTKERNNHNIPNTITIDIIKNIKRSIKNDKKILYESEVNPEMYKYSIELANKYKELI